MIALRGAPPGRTYLRDLVGKDPADVVLGWIDRASRDGLAPTPLLVRHYFEALLVLPITAVVNLCDEARRAAPSEDADIEAAVLKAINRIEARAWGRFG